MVKVPKCVRILWISLLISWCIGILYTILYVELFFGYDGAFTRLITNYNGQRRSSHVQRAIDEWNADSGVLPSTAENIETFKALIGIGCIKCGSTYFHSALSHRCRLWEKDNNQSIYHYIFKVQEAHYFDQCTDCSFKGYIDHLVADQMHDPLQFRSSNKIWIFGEKTVTYFDDYNTAHLLSFYGHRYDIYFYVVLRNPVKQLWSHLWMRTDACDPNDGILRIQCLLIRNENYRLQRDNMEDVHRMEQYITEFLDQRIQRELPIFWEIMDKLKIDNAVNEGDNRDIDVDELVALLQRRSSDILHYYSHVFIQSCHYALIVMWYQQWNWWHEQIGISVEFKERFRIIQIEKVFSSEVMREEHIKRLICWVGGYNDVKSCINSGMVKTDVKKIEMVRPRQYAPDIVDVLDLNVSDVIKRFYNDSQRRLQWFLRDNSHLMIGQFYPYW